jgi:hypothetical protein
MALRSTIAYVLKCVPIAKSGYVIKWAMVVDFYGYMHPIVFHLLSHQCPTISMVVHIMKETLDHLLGGV